MSSVGPIGRLGRYTATHFRVVAVAWALLAVSLGVFAPKVEHALSGAGWEATGSESVQARELVDRNFQGLSSSALQVVVHSPTKTVSDPAFQETITSAQRTLKADSRVASVMPPRPGQSISRDGHTAVIQAGAADNPNEMVRAADDRPIAFLCRSGHRSALAARRAAKRRPDLASIEGGMDAWIAADLPTARCRPPHCDRRTA